MNDNKSRDIFYGVVAIATLIVAIIGATLAYFSITAGSNEGSIAAKAASVSINYNDRFVIAQADQLIPSRFDIVQYFYEEIDQDNDLLGSQSNVCIDADGQQICSIYRFAVSVDAGDAAQTIYAYLNSESNEFTNLSYGVRKVGCTPSGNEEVLPQDFEENDEVVGPYDNCWIEVGDNKKFRGLEACDGTEGESDSCFATVDGKKEYFTGNPQAKFSLFGYTNDNPNSDTVNAGTTNTYDLVIFLNENGFQNAEQSKEYSGTIKVELSGYTGRDTITGKATPSNP